jgi:nuclear pore complex protein Nup93
MARESGCKFLSLPGGSTHHVTVIWFSLLTYYLLAQKIGALDILPLQANGDPSTIRHYASKFAGLSQTVAINVPNLLMWTITCCVRQRERLLTGQYSGNEGTRSMMVRNLAQISVDLTTYTGQLKYRFPPHLHEALARASAN